MLNFRIISVVILTLFSLEINLKAQSTDSLVKDAMTNTFEIYKFPINKNFIAISALPEKEYLEEDLNLISEAKISNIITLVESSELRNYGLDGFFQEIDSKNIRYFHFPIVDYGIPSQAQMDSIYNQLTSILANEENVLIHCKGGLGRSGTVLAAFVKNYMQESNPIEAVRKIRGEQAIENKLQEQFVLDYFFKH